MNKETNTIKALCLKCYNLAVGVLNILLSGGVCWGWGGEVGPETRDKTEQNKKETWRPKPPLLLFSIEQIFIIHAWYARGEEATKLRLGPLRSLFV